MSGKSKEFDNDGKIGNMTSSEQLIVSQDVMRTFDTNDFIQ